MKRNHILTIVTTILVGLNILSTSSVNAAVIEPQVTSKAALVADLHTGQVIADKNGSQRLPIASISKLLVIYMTEQAIKDQKIKRTDMVTVAPDIATFSNDTSVVNVPLTTNRQYTINQLEEASLLPSSNSAAMALANMVAGNQENYYKKAEQLLTSWDIKDAHIYSASGLKDGDMGSFNSPSVADNQENLLSAREVAIVAKKVVDKFPNILDTTSKTATSFPTFSGSTQTLESTDKLLDNPTYKFTGLKTGVTSTDGGNFVGITKINNEPVITVTLNSGSSDYTKFTDTIKMLDQVTNGTEQRTIDKQEKHNFVDAKTKNGTVTVKPTADFKVFVAKDSNYKLTSKMHYKKVKAPFKKSQVIATRKLDFKNADFLGKTLTIKYSPTKKINKTNIFVIGFRNFMNLF